METSYFLSSGSASSREEKILTPLDEPAGNLAGKTVVKGNKPFYFVLIIIGVISLGVVGGTGFANLGNHLGWWPVAGFSHLSKMGAIAMVALGGGAGLLLIIGGLIGLAKTGPSKGGRSPELGPVLTDQPLTLESATLQLTNRTYTWFLQDNGFYTLIIKHFPEEEKEGRIETRVNIYWEDMDSMELAYNLENLYYTFIKTSPMPTDMLLSKKEIEEKVKDNQFTFVSQPNGEYTLVIYYPNKDYLYVKGLEKEELGSKIIYLKNLGQLYVETSPLPSQVWEMGNKHDFTSESNDLDVTDYLLSDDNQSGKSKTKSSSSSDYSV